MKNRPLMIISLLTTQLLLGCGQKKTKNVLQTATLRSESETQSLASKPFIFQNYLPQNLSLLVKPSESIPAPTSKNYLKISVQYDANIQQLNGKKLGKRGAAIYKFIGHKIILDSIHSKKILDMLRDRFDIKQVVFAAKEIEIKSSLKIPAANVEFYAQQISVAPTIQIDLSAQNNLVAPAQFADGQDGDKGGDLYFYTPQLNLSSRTLPLLISHGAAGQVGGAGQNGIAGKSIPTVQSPNVTYISRIFRECNRETGRPICVSTKHSEGQQELPTSGSDAKAGGVPGLGGDSGQLYVATPIADSLVDLACGESPLPTVYLGGIAGKPIHAVQIINGQQKSFSTFPGKDAVAPVKNDTCSVGNIVVDPKYKKWLTADNMQMINRYAQDLFKLNHFANAQKLLELLQNYQVDSSTSSFLLESSKFQVNKSLYNLNSGLDYYGHDAKWTPSFSLLANLGQWMEDKQYYLELFAFAAKLKKSSDENQSQLDELEQLSTTIFTHITQLQEQQTEVIKLLPEIKEELAKVSLHEQEIRNSLQKLDEQIRQQAQEELEPSGLLKAIRAMGAIATVIPAGQPAFRAVGMGLNTFANLLESDQPVRDLFTQVPKLTKMFNTEMLEASAQDWNHKWQQVTPTRFAELDSSAERLDYAKDVVNFATPVVKEIQQQFTSLQQNSVSQSALERKISELRMQHPRFNQLLDELQQLIREKMVIVNKLRTFEVTLLKLGEELHQTMENYVTTKQQYAERLKGWSNQESDFAQQLEREAQAGLAYGIYLLEKSFVSTFAVALDLSSQQQTMMRAILRSAQEVEGTLVENVDILAMTFQQELVKIKQQIKEQLVTHVVKEHTFSFSLTPQELRELNQKGEVLISTFDPRLKLGAFDNIRLNGMELSSIVGSWSDQDEIILERVGDFYIEREGNVYAFSGNLHTEIASFYYRSALQKFKQSNIDHSMNRILATVLGMSDREQQSPYMRPGVKAVYRIKLSGSNIHRVKQMTLLFNCAVNRK